MATALGLQPPAMPEGIDASSAGSYMILESPLLALVLIGLSRSIAGSFWVRSLMLGSLTWVSNSLNNQIEAAYFGMMASGFWFTIVTFLVPSFLVAAAVAWLFPPTSKEPTFISAGRGDWDWARSCSCRSITSLACLSSPSRGNTMSKGYMACRSRPWINCS